MFKMVLCQSETWLRFCPISSHVKDAELTYCWAHLLYIYKALCLCDCPTQSISTQDLYLLHNLHPLRRRIATHLHVAPPYTLTFSHHVDCKYKWLLDTAGWLSGGVREVTGLHALFNREADSRSVLGGGRPGALWGSAQCQQSPSSGQNQKCRR